MLTGDTLYSQGEREKQMAAAVESDLIIMTSELLDSLTRRAKSERYDWMTKETALLIADEAHLVTMEGRGHVIESALMRFTKLNPNAKICFLSATMKNVGELGEWLTQLNGKKTTTIYNEWRPVKLEINYIEHPTPRNSWGKMDYQITQREKEKMVVNLVMDKPDEKFLVFVHAKNTGRSIIRRLGEVGEDARFHNADLDSSDRKEIEESFKDRNKGIRVLVSTSTTAIGVNLPARNVVIVGVHRGINEVDELDLIQECGRAGRPQYDDKGFVYLLVPEGTVSVWSEKINNPRPVTSIMNNHQILAFHVLAEIDNKEIKSERELMSWYQRTLAYKQNINPFTNIDAEALMRDLEKMEMIGFNGIIPFVTGLGKISSWFYFSPWDVYAWYKNFSKIFARERDDLTMAWAIGDIPSNDPGYIGKDIQKDAEEIRWALRNRGIQCSCAVGTVIGIYHSLMGMDMKEDDGLIRTIRRGIIFDIDRITYALSLMDGMYAKWGKETIWKTLPQRIKYGIG